MTYGKCCYGCNAVDYLCPLITEPSQYLLAADIDGIKMMTIGDQSDGHVYTIIPATSVCGNFHGLARDNMYIYFSSYYGYVFSVIYGYIICL